MTSFRRTSEGYQNVLCYCGRGCDNHFRTIANTQNGEVSGDTVFYYQQQGFLVSATYSGGAILFGHLVGLVDAEGVMDIRYHHVNDKGELMTGP